MKMSDSDMPENRSLVAWVQTTETVVTVIIPRRLSSNVSMISWRQTMLVVVKEYAEKEVRHSSQLQGLSLKCNNNVSIVCFHA